MRAIQLGFSGDIHGSLVALAALCEEAPANLDIRFDLAMTQMMQGMYEEACANLRHILALDPGHRKALDQATFC